MSLTVAANQGPREPREEPGEIFGLPVIYEYRKGDTKKSKESPYSDWGWPMYEDYGFFVDSLGNDGEEADFFDAGDRDSKVVFLLPLLKRDEEVLDEYKILIGFKDLEAANAFTQMQYGSCLCDPLLVISPEDVTDFIASQREGAKRFRSALSEKVALKVYV